MTSLFDGLHTVKNRLVHTDIPDDEKIEYLAEFIDSIISTTHDLDHATHHFTTNKTNKVFARFWQKLEREIEFWNERFEGEESFEQKFGYDRLKREFKEEEE